MSEAILETQPKKDTKSATTERARNIAQGSNAGVPDFSKLVADHRAYFLSGATRPAEWRESQLRALRSMLKDHAEDFYAALWSDLRRNRIEADLVDVKCTTSEIDHVLAHLRHWMKVLISTPYQLAPSHGEVRFDPLGVGLIIGTWNYPVMLTLSPLVAAISAGNCAVIKPSEVSPATGEVIARYLPEYLDRKAFSVVLGAVPEMTALLEQPWDHIFFTGGTTVAKIVMTAAAKNLTPVVLELGGKNPTIVHSSANLKVAARRIAFGRWVNCGQSCTAPDYVLVFRDVAAEFLKYIKKTLVEFYGENPQNSPDLGRIVSTHHFDRLVRLLDSGTIFHGGQHDRNDRFIAPTVLTNVSPDSPAMQEEIFGPILPVLEVDSVEEVIKFVNARPSPLGLYVFSEDSSVTEQILSSTSSGDADVNDCTLQPTIHDLPFGGVGNSGMGKYHGEWGFRAYSNARGVLSHSTKIDIGGLRYPPYDHNRILRERVLVTGVSSGLGVETARSLAAHGAQVVGAARDLKKADAATDQVRKDAAANGGSFEVIALDLASLTSVRECADALLKKGETFDVIIANAGVMETPFGPTEDGKLEKEMTTNMTYENDQVTQAMEVNFS